jgi:hypothetical protein
MFEQIKSIVLDVGSILTAIGVIALFTKKGREWLNKPAMDAIAKNSILTKKMKFFYLSIPSLTMQTQ